MFSTFVHESGHALACFHARRTVNAAGFMIYLGIPIFFIDTTDVWMADRRARILTSVAGPYSECIMAGAASLAALFFPAGPATAFLFRFAVLSYIAVAQNLTPFLRLDGYYILMDAIDEANLREQAFEFVRQELRQKLLSRERLTRREKLFASYATMAGLFAIFAVLFSTFFWSRILRTAVRSAWHGGWVSRVLVSFLVVLILAPLLRAVLRLARRAVRRLRLLLRLVRRAAERAWRQEAVELFRGLPLTGELSEEARVEIADHVRLLRLEGGQTVVKTGERGDDFFVVRSGTLEVTVQDDDGSERVVRTLDRGRSFGEIALLESTTRTATVRAVEPAQVFAIDKGTFDRSLGDDIEVAEEMRQRLVSMGHVRSLAPFRGLDDADVARMLRGASWRSFAPSDRIVKQGDEAESFFVIASGQVDVIENRRVVRRIGPGGYFGDTALLEDVPRTATVRAATPTRILELDRKAFERVLAKSFRRGRLATSRALSREWER
jgi:putative peptide zinc metalloprotease protein